MPRSGNATKRVTAQARARIVGVSVRAVASIGACAAVLASAAAGNRDRAAHDAAALLTRAVVPPGAVRLARSPGGAATGIDNGLPGFATPVLADRYAWWRAPGQPAAVLAFLRTHPPAGAKLRSTGSGGAAGEETSWYRWYAFPPVKGVLAFRGLLVKLAALSAHTVVLRVDAQVIWIVPRPPSERIPAGVHEIDVVRARRGQRPAVSLSVTQPGEVARIVSLVDALPTVQPGAIACPMLPVDGPRVTLTFRAAGAGAVLAQASQPADLPGPTTACDPMSLAIRGRARTPLLGGIGALRAVGRLLGVTLTKSR